MLKFDFSEAKQNWNDLKAALRGRARDTDNAMPASLPGALVTKLETKDTVIWTIFATVSVSSMIMILFFIDSFNVEQEKYQTVLTSIGRSPSEYRALMAEMGTGTPTLRQP